MKRFRVDAHDGYQLINRQFFDALPDAESHYRQTDAPPLVIMQLWQYEPPVDLVFGHKIRGGWRMLAEKIGMEEFP